MWSIAGWEQLPEPSLIEACQKLGIVKCDRLYKNELPAFLRRSSIKEDEECISK
jgi:hypothetical protein